MHLKPKRTTGKNTLTSITLTIVFATAIATGITHALAFPWLGILTMIIGFSTATAINFPRE